MKPNKVMHMELASNFIFPPALSFLSEIQICPCHSSCLWTTVGFPTFSRPSPMQKQETQRLLVCSSQRTFQALSCIKASWRPFLCEPIELQCLSHSFIWWTPVSPLSPCWRLALCYMIPGRKKEQVPPITPQCIGQCSILITWSATVVYV